MWPFVIGFFSLAFSRFISIVTWSSTPFFFITEYYYSAIFVDIPPSVYPFTWCTFGLFPARLMGPAGSWDHAGWWIPARIWGLVALSYLRGRTLVRQDIQWVHMNFTEVPRSGVGQLISFRDFYSPRIRFYIWHLENAVHFFNIRE